nr:NBS-LRR disease resistance protein [Dasypyrum villosum]
MGVINPLLGKLTKLLGEEYKKLAGVRKQASFLKDELSAMKALLDKMELMDKLDPSAKNWRDHIREMSYDMENCIDDFMHDIESADAKKSFVRKMAQRLRRLGRRHHIANRIEQLKVLVVEANARRERYNIGDCINLSPGAVVVDDRITTLYNEATCLVGIDGPREELVSLLMDYEKKTKVISVVGFGGLGKTTLAKQVYDEIGGQFTCKAFFSVSQRPNVKSLLISLQLKLRIKESFHAHELQDIIDRLREHLEHKRYFIVVDDLWDQRAWNIISCAFPDNGNGSRIIVTTRLNDVAVKACQSDRACIYRMKPLEEKDSRTLFLNRLFGLQNVCPPEFKEISVEILKKCGGLPLAIITIASLLACNEARLLNGWENIKNSLGAKFATEPTLEDMRGILNLSYMHLPVYLRPCLLYLGMYPEDREIGCDDLVRQWIAEGFVCSLHGADLDDIAKSYLNELINRSLIQPVNTYHGKVLSCRVHDMILDLILSKSTKDNFLSVAHSYEDMAKMHGCDMSEVRSYARFRGSKYTPPLSQFKYVRVLAFEFPYNWKTTIDLTAIGHLFLLRYLKVSASTVVVALPAEIQGLIHLETLELCCEPMQSFPSDVSCLANLFHLRLPSSIALPEGINNMKSIRTLNCGNMSESSLEDIKGLGELTNLKGLNLSTSYNKFLMLEQEDALVSSIGRLRDLKRLSLCFSRGCCGPDSQLESLTDPPTRLEELYLLKLEFIRVPKWIDELRCLRILRLRVLHMSSDEFRVLGELPSLVDVRVHVGNVSQDKAVVVDMGLFPVLEYFWFESDEDVNKYLCFKTGAMPKLQSLVLQFSWREWIGVTPVGMEHLPCLQEIGLSLLSNGAESTKNREDVRADLESAFKSVARVHPRHPSVSLW